MSPLKEKRIPSDPEQSPYRMNHPTRKAELKAMREFLARRKKGESR